MNELDVLAQAKKTWPYAHFVTARKQYRCDNCPGVIAPGTQYLDPGDSNPDRAGGFGGYRYCLECGGGSPGREPWEN